MLLQAIGPVELPSWAWLLVLLVGGAFVAWFVERVVIMSLRRAHDRTKRAALGAAVRVLHPSLVFLLFVSLVWAGVRLFPFALSPLAVRIVDAAGITLVIFAVAMLLARLLGAVLHLPARREPRWAPVSAVGSRVLSLIIYAIAGLMVLSSYGLEITPLLTSLGIAGLAVALALQDTLANFFAGVWIQASRQLPAGHLIHLDRPDVLGFVVEVGWRATKIRTLPNNIVIIPNQTIAQANITDFDLPEPRMGVPMLFYTGFESDPELALKLILDAMNEVARETGDVLAEPAPFGRLNGFTERGYEYWVSFQATSGTAARPSANASCRSFRPMESESRTPFGKRTRSPRGAATSRAASRGEATARTAPTRRPPTRHAKPTSARSRPTDTRPRPHSRPGENANATAAPSIAVADSARLS
jgi:small-conductance mechanosensitive channel